MPKPAWPPVGSPAAPTRVFAFVGDGRRPLMATPLSRFHPVPLAHAPRPTPRTRTLRLPTWRPGFHTLALRVRSKG